LILVGLVLLGYGIYTLFVPETIFSIGSLDVKAQDNNNNSYITIGLGLLALLIGLLGSRKS
jgi:LPXTG-motif cell wall-anchored protein